MLRFFSHLLPVFVTVWSKITMSCLTCWHFKFLLSMVNKHRISLYLLACVMLFFGCHGHWLNLCFHTAGFPDRLIHLLYVMASSEIGVKNYVMVIQQSKNFGHKDIGPLL